MIPRTITTPNVTFEALEVGSGPLVLCLHGFPDQARSFRHQLPVLADAGFHAVAPYMRGYAPTSAPADGRYDALALGEDVGALIEALGYDDAIVFGHDWGAVATYYGTLLAPHRVRKIITAAVPYGPQLFRAFVTDYAQQRRSWYMMFFQQALADVTLRHDDFAFIDHLVADWSPRWPWPIEDREATKATFRRPGTVAAALAYYRHTMGPAFADPSMLEASAAASAAPIPVPGLMLHGADDACIGADLVPAMAEYFPAGLSVEIIPGAGHFVHQERPDLVNRLVLDFLRA
ncbi:MAG TPA: alpha/beta hydrolase [Candidatus Binatia bacterium]|jgi:pimeloyl-ACP methyl ester carboxylesterase|nr:alpha/beta hydrolase [Candidatus Binatia bacterium]